MLINGQPIENMKWDAVLELLRTLRSAFPDRNLDLTTDEPKSFTAQAANAAYEKWQDTGLKKDRNEALKLYMSDAQASQETGDWLAEASALKKIGAI